SASWSRRGGEPRPLPAPTPERPGRLRDARRDPDRTGDRAAAAVPGGSRSLPFSPPLDLEREPSHDGWRGNGRRGQAGTPHARLRQGEAATGDGTLARIEPVLEGRTLLVPHELFPV